MLNWVNSFTDQLKKSPGLRIAFETALGAAVGAAFIAKAKKAFNWLQDLIGKGKQAAQLAATTANTAALDANTAALLGNDVAGGAGALAGEGAVAGAGGITAGGLLTIAAPIAAGALALFYAANAGPKTNPKYLPKTGTNLGGGGRDRVDLLHPNDWQVGNKKTTTNVTVTVNGKSGGKASGPTRADFPSRR